MKNSFFVSALALAITLCVPVSSFAATATRGVGVATNVNSSCLIRINRHMEFGEYDSVVSPNSDHQSQQQVTEISCTRKTTGVRLAYGQGQNPAAGSSCANPLRRMRSSDGGYLSYVILRSFGQPTVGCQTGVNDRGFTNSFATSSDFIPATTFGVIGKGQSVPVGEYTDAISVTVSF